MRKTFVYSCFLAASCGLLPVLATSQELVHAFTGTISSANSGSKTITVFRDGGAQGTFDEVTAGKTRYAFDKKLASQSVSANSFNEQGAYAVIFYIGMIENPTVVAVKPLGKGPFASFDGTVTSFNGHDHTIAITDQSGAAKTFKMNANTVAEGPMGAVEGFKLQANKGDRVRIVSDSEEGSPTALFIKDL
ncbi:hypothetical protein DYQ86_18360 [Acidobacteria bacterium AB60]|nr:hypothetical protein DYQ86_18360 [Acidobacteria bacterium AB60]